MQQSIDNIATGGQVDLTNYYTKNEIDNKGFLTEHQDISSKQDKLKAGANITISDDNTISATGGVKVDSELSDTSENPVQNKVVKAALDAAYNPTNKEDLNKMETQEYKTGKETIDGTEYEYEEYEDQDTGVIERYYFSGNDLKYIKSIDEDGEEELMKVIKLSSEVDDSIFEVPSDYQKVEM